MSFQSVKKIRFCFVVLFTLSLVISIVYVLSSCKSIQNENNQKIKLTDLCGRSIYLDKPAERIAALAASDCEVLSAIGAQDKIIARGSYCDYPDEILHIKDVGSGNLMNLEEIIAIKPDVVVMSKTGFTTDQVNSIENAGIKTLVNEANTISDTYSYISLLGELTGNIKQATDLIDNMKSTIDNIENKIAKSNETNKSVYFEVSPLKYGLWTAGKNTFIDEISSILKLNNIFSDVEKWSEISQEQVIKRNPQIIVSLTPNGENNSKMIDDITTRAGWEQIDAINNKEVFSIDSNLVTRPGPRLIDSIEILYKDIYES